MAMRVHCNATRLMADDCRDLFEWEIEALMALYDVEIKYTDG